MSGEPENHGEDSRNIASNLVPPPCEASITLRPGKFCVYIHSAGGRIIYVGQGVYTRPFSMGRGRNYVWRKLVEGVDVIEVQIVGWYDTQREALDVEVRLIRELNPAANWPTPQRPRLKPRHNREMLRDLASATAVLAAHALKKFQECGSTKGSDGRSILLTDEEKQSMSAAVPQLPGPFIGPLPKWNKKIFIQSLMRKPGSNRLPRKRRQSV